MAVNRTSKSRNVAPASCRLSWRRLAASAVGEDAHRTAAGTAALRSCFGVSCSSVAERGGCWDAEAVEIN